MGLFSPIYLRVTAESNKNKKKKAFTALSRVSRPEKLYRAALKSKYGDIRSEAIKKLGELREDGYLEKLAEKRRLERIDKISKRAPYNPYLEEEP